MDCCVEGVEWWPVTRQKFRETGKLAIAVNKGVGNSGGKCKCIYLNAGDRLQIELLKSLVISETLSSSIIS